MEILKIAGFVLCAAVIASTVERYTPWAAILISLCTGIAAALYILPKAGKIAESLTEMFELIDGENGYVMLLFKVIAISFIAQITSQICTDAGQKAMGDKIEMAARIFIAVYSLPLISDMLALISDIMGG